MLRSTLRRFGHSGSTMIRTNADLHACLSGLRLCRAGVEPAGALRKVSDQIILLPRTSPSTRSFWMPIDRYSSDPRPGGERATAIALLVDELRHAPEERRAPPVAAPRAASREPLPVTVAGAGLPRPVGRGGDAGFHAGRLSEFAQRIGRTTARNTSPPRFGVVVSRCL